MALLITSKLAFYMLACFFYCRNYIAIVLRLMGIYFQEGEEK